MSIEEDVVKQNQRADGGVLLSLRILKRARHLKQLTKEEKKCNAHVLGTVITYRSANGMLPEVQVNKVIGRPIAIGAYYVRYDIGIQESMSPDDVVACANLYHETQKLFMESSSSTSLSLPKIASTILDKDDDASGCQSLLKYVNLPFIDTDILLLEAERRLFWENSRREPSKSVTPVWNKENYCELQTQTQCPFKLCDISRFNLREKKKSSAFQNRLVDMKVRRKKRSKKSIPATIQWQSAPPTWDQGNESSTSIDTNRNSISSTPNRVMHQNSPTFGNSEVKRNSMIPYSIDTEELRCDSAFSVVITRKKIGKNIRDTTKRKFPGAMNMNKKVIDVDDSVENATFDAISMIKNPLLSVVGEDGNEVE